jgi:hypothetical protein
MEWEILYEELKKKQLIIMLLLSSISCFILGHSHTSGIIVGGLISFANLMFLQHTVKKAFGTDFRQKSGKISIFLKYYFRLLALGIILFIVLRYKLVHPVGLVIGFSTLVIAITIIGIKAAIKAGGREA